MWDHVCGIMWDHVCGIMSVGSCGIMSVGSCLLLIVSGGLSEVSIAGYDCVTEAELTKNEVKGSKPAGGFEPPVIRID